MSCNTPSIIREGGGGGGGGGSTGVAQRVVQRTNEIGYWKFVIKFDPGLVIRYLQQVTKEESMKTLEDRSKHIKSLMGVDNGEDNIVVIEASPVVESKPNGAVENTIKWLQGQVRTKRFAVERNIGNKIDTDPNHWQRLVEYAVDMFTGHKVGQDGSTPHRREEGFESNAPIVAVGEEALYHITRDAVGRPKSEPFWMEHYG